MRGFMASVFFHKEKYNIGLWIRALRAPFFTASIIPVILGTAVAFAHNGELNIVYFILVLSGAVSLHAGGNLLNDYFDFKSGVDVINKNPTPFSGGSGVLVEELLTPNSILIASIISSIIGLLIGAYLALKLGLIIILLGGLGVFLGIIYTAPPFKLVYRGLGEGVVALAFGPIIVFGSYFVQTAIFSISPIVASMPIALLIAAILYINEFPDYEADRMAGKNQLVVKLGFEKAVKGYGLVMALTYLSIIFSIIFSFMPFPVILGLLTVPMARNAYKILRENYRNVLQLLPANALTIKVHLLTGILLSIGYVFSYLI
jgi:1,4-dihydroxy-2-naphthoate octaprenyltransferase